MLSNKEIVCPDNLLNVAKKKKDVMFKSAWLNLSQTQLIKEYFKFDEYFAPVIAPGRTHVYQDYSNFGYLLLGRVIEKLSGKPYETYIKENPLILYLPQH